MKQNPRGKMNWKIFLIATLTTVGIITATALFRRYKTSMCSSTEISKSMDSYKQCLLSENFEVARTLNFEICQFMDRIFVRCGQILRKCMTEEELK